VNVRQAPEDGWAFLRYSFLRPNVLYLEIASHKLYDDKESSRSPKQARATLEKALRSEPAALDELCVCMRAASADEASR
jgi:hypothetical protein